MNELGQSEDSIKDFPNWNEKLASDSEAIVKADRSEDESIDQMKQETIERVNKEMELETEDNDAEHISLTA
jgi:hypothetical protein